MAKEQNKSHMQTTGSVFDTRDIHQVLSVAPGSLGEHGVRRSSVILEVQEGLQTFRSVRLTTVEVLFFCEYAILLENFLRTNKGLNVRAMCENQAALLETVCRSFIFIRC